MMSHQLGSQEVMRRCLELARHGAGFVSPNPMVGAVLIHDGRVVGEGYHRRFGGPHAEVEAIRSVLDSRLLPECTLFVSLEPCSHFGKTPPCADLIIDSKIPKVIVAVGDPNPKVQGRGIERLRRQGVTVECGVLASEARELNRGFFSFHERNRPWVVLKWAETADRFIARSDGSSKWISGERSRSLVHGWRAVEDAVLVGAATARLDNPELTVRHVEGRNPLRVVVGREGSLPEGAHLVNAAAPTLILTESRNEDRGTITYRALPSGRSLAQSICDVLYAEKVLSVIVEGGAEILRAFISANLWDEARIFRSTSNFGAGLRAPELPGEPCCREEVGEDTLLWYRNRT